MPRYTQAQLDRLNEMISLGVTRGTFEDRTLEFRSLEQMQQLRREMEAELNQATAGKSQRIIVSTRKGL